MIVNTPLRPFLHLLMASSVLFAACGDDGGETTPDTSSGATDTTQSSATDTAQASATDTAASSAPDVAEDVADAAQDVADAAPDVADAAPDAAEEVALVEGCPMVGTFLTVAVFCAGADISEDWFSYYQRMEFTITATDTGCAMHEVYETADQCHEDWATTMTSKGGRQWEVHTRPTNCTPDACKFFDDDAPCAVSEELSGYEATFVPGETTLAFALTSASCGGDVITFLMERQP